MRTDRDRALPAPTSRRSVKRTGAREAPARKEDSVTVQYAQPPLPAQIGELEQRIRQLKAQMQAQQRRVCNGDWLDQVVDPHHDAHHAHARLVGANLRDRRQGLGLSQQQLALRIDAEQQHVCMWENGHHTPNPRSLERLAAALACHWTSFFARRNGEEA